MKKSILFFCFCTISLSICGCESKINDPLVNESKLVHNSKKQLQKVIINGIEIQMTKAVQDSTMFLPYVEMTDTSDNKH